MFGPIKYEGVVLHHSASPAKTTDRALIDLWHKQNGWGKKLNSGFQYPCGYHFVINWNGTIETGRPLGIAGAHTEGYNDKYIGICFCGNFETEHPSWEQLKAGSELLAWLQNLYEIPDYQVYLHRELSRTLCPGRNFNREKILAVKKKYFN